MSQHQHDIPNICGRKAWLVKPTHVRVVNTGAKPRIHVDGLKKRDGSFIRFKSVSRAEAHIKNMGLEVNNG